MQLLINIKFKDMKKFFILFLIVFHSIVNFGQTFFSNGLISNGNVSIQNNSAIQLGGFYFAYNADSIWIENPNGIWFAKITTINNDSSIYSDTADYANKADSSIYSDTADYAKNLLYLPEEQDLNIYIKHYPAGNDTTADGSESHPFHTIVGAALSINTQINSYVQFIVDTGNWEWGLNEAAIFSRFELTGNDMEIRGIYDTIIPSVSLAYDADTILKYTATSSGVTLTEDSLINYFVKDGIHFYPISHNTAGTNTWEMEIAKSSKNMTRPIVRLRTTFNLTDDFALDFNLMAQNRGTLNFNELIFVRNGNVEHERCLRMRKYINCKFSINGSFSIGAYAETALNQIVMKGTVIENTSAIDYVVRLKRFIGNLSLTRMLFRNNSSISGALFLSDCYEGSNIYMTDILFMGDKDNLHPAIQLTHDPTLEIRKVISIRDCSYAFENTSYMADAFHLFSSLDYLPGIIYLFDTPNLFSSEGHNVKITLLGGVISNSTFNYYATDDFFTNNLNKFNYINVSSVNNLMPQAYYIPDSVDASPIKQRKIYDESGNYWKYGTSKVDSSIYSDTANYANKADSNAVTYTADTGYFNNMYNNRIKADNDSLNLDGLSILWDYSINNKDYKSGNNFDYLGLYDAYNILAYGNSSYRSQLSNYGDHIYMESRTLSNYFYKFDLFYNKAYLIYDTPSAAEDTVYMFNPDSLLAPDIDAKFNSVSFNSALSVNSDVIIRESTGSVNSQFNCDLADNPNAITIHENTLDENKYSLNWQGVKIDAGSSTGYSILDASDNVIAGFSSAGIGADILQVNDKLVIPYMNSCDLTNNAPTDAEFTTCGVVGNSPQPAVTIVRDASGGDKYLVISTDGSTYNWIKFGNELSESSIGTIADNDATPDITGAVNWTYNGSANSVVITDLDNPIVGKTYKIIGNSDTYTITINDSGNFNLSASWVGGADDIITIFVQADNDYIEISRSDN